MKNFKLIEGDKITASNVAGIGYIEYSYIYSENVAVFYTGDYPITIRLKKLKNIRVAIPFHKKVTAL